MKKVTTHLLREHILIEEKLLILWGLLSTLSEGKFTSPEIWHDLLSFFSNFADKIHHEKEELIVLPRLVAHGFPLMGGGFCTYFKGLEMIRPSMRSLINEVEAALQKSSAINHLQELDPTEELLRKCPLPILEEHIYGRKLLKALYQEVGTLESGKTSDTSKLEDWGLRYHNMLKEHINKENLCFFPMVDDTLTDQEQDEILREFEQMNQTEKLSSPTS